MLKFLIALFLVLAMSIPAPVLADPTAVAANQLLAAQLADAISTQELLKHPGAFERDPLAKPFTHSYEAQIGAAIALNVAGRILFKHAPEVLRVFTYIEGAAVANNVNVIIKDAHQ
jgi:hypothetical protein